MPKDMKDQVIAIDFDGVIAEYKTWKGIGVFGKPITSAKWALERFREMGAIVVIHTCRKEIALVSAYLKDNKIPFDFINFSPKNPKLKLNPNKIGADIYIDDKGVSFRGDWKNTYLEVLNFVRWGNKM